jgi:preprotein translocase subunit SecE
MNAKAEVQGSKSDSLMLVLALAIAIGGSVAFYYFAEQYALLYRVLALLAVMGVAVTISMRTTKGRATWDFLKDSRTEIRKVVWPTRAETMQTTLIVMLMVILVGIMLWIMDSFLLWAVKLLTGQGD